MAVTLLVAMRSSSLILTGASMTTKKTSVCDAVHLFVIFAICSACCEKHVRRNFNWNFVRSTLSHTGDVILWSFKWQMLVRPQLPTHRTDRKVH